ncbi:MAG: sodium:solute symporter family transporter [Myxococcota bacterium]
MLGAGDHLAIVLYGAAVLWIGLRAGRGRATSDELLLAGRDLPAWAALGSLVATELSAATFLGVPHAAYLGDWSYLELAFGALVGKGLLAVFVIPRYHALGIATVYGFVESRFGPRARRASAFCFVAGRIVASGARLFIAALAVSVVLGVEPLLAIVVLGLVAGIYTTIGGLRAVVMTDLLQGAVLLTAALAGLFVLGTLVPGGWSEIFLWASESDRTRVFHFGPFFALGSTQPFGTAFIGACVLTLATHATDHDMVQRLLATRDGRAGARALWGSAFVNFPVTLLFLMLGTGLARFYAEGSAYDVSDAARIVPLFALHELPVGLRGLLFAGLFAAAMSSFDSAICAIAAAWVVDVAPSSGLPLASRVRRVSTVTCVVLVLAAGGIAAYHAALSDGAGARGFSLVDLALSSMTLLYGGLLAVFGVGFCSQREPSEQSDRAALVGLGVGAAVGLGLFVHPVLLGHIVVAWTWWIPISSSTAVLAILALRGRRP